MPPAEWYVQESSSIGRFVAYEDPQTNTHYHVGSCLVTCYHSLRLPTWWMEDGSIGLRRRCILQPLLPFSADLAGTSPAMQFAPEAMRFLQPGQEQLLVAQATSHCGCEHVACCFCDVSGMHHHPGLRLPLPTPAPCSTDSYRRPFKRAIADVHTQLVEFKWVPHALLYGWSGNEVRPWRLPCLPRQPPGHRFACIIP